VRKPLRPSSDIVQGMEEADANAILAKNLRYFMQRPSSPYRTANALAEAAGMSANTVRYYLDEKKRPARSANGVGFPTMNKLSKLAEKLGCEVWELLHPDIERSLSEREMYRKVQADFERIREGANQAADAKPVSRLRTS
jgi:transcriptional regulator with XRE-family HTH domain